METNTDEFPASRTLFSRFPPPSLVFLASVCFFYCKILCNVAKFISFSPDSRPPGYLVSRPLFFRLPYTSRPNYSRIPAPLSRSTIMVAALDLRNDSRDHNIDSRNSSCRRKLLSSSLKVPVYLTTFLVWSKMSLSWSIEL